MNKEVIKLTEEMGKIYVKRAELKAKIKVLEEKVWESRSKDISEAIKKPFRSKKIKRSSKRKKK